MREMVIQTLMGAISSVAFAVFFNVRGKKLLLFFFGSALDWAVYLLAVHHGYNEFTGMLFATMTAALLSEAFARIIRAPVLILLVPMLVPLIPGRGLYNTMDALIQSDRVRFIDSGISTISCGAAICLGIICVTAITHMIFTIWHYIRKHRPKH
jgi:uncharacterized membrane protein YjjB (DUF3815 family)